MNESIFIHQVHRIIKHIKQNEFPSETLTGLLYLVQVISLLPPLLYDWFINVEFSRSCYILMFDCVTNSLKFWNQLSKHDSQQRLFWGPYTTQYVWLHQDPDHNSRNASTTHRMVQLRTLHKSC